MATKHLLCRRLVENTRFQEGFQPLACSEDPEDVCFDNHVEAWIDFKEGVRRIALALEINTAFPEYTCKELMDTLASVPSYINAEYAILKSINGRGMNMPSYSVRSIKRDLTGDTDKFKAVIVSDVKVKQVTCDPGPSHINVVPTNHNYTSVEENGPHVINLLPDEVEMDNFNLDVTVRNPSTEPNRQTFSSEPNVQNVSLEPIMPSLIPLPTFPYPGPSTSTQDVSNTRRLVHGCMVFKPLKRQHMEPVKSSSWPPVKKRHSGVKCKMAPAPQFQEVIVLDQPNPELVQKLVNTLAEIFSDCNMEYIMKICKGKEYTSERVDRLTDFLLSRDYPKKEVEKPMDFDAQLEMMMSVLPDADPDYLSRELTKMKNDDEFKMFISTALERRNYPKLAEANRRKQLFAQARQYTTDFDPVEFLKKIPDPEAYFNPDTFRIATIEPRRYDDINFMRNFLRNHFNKVSVKMINHVFDGSKTFHQAVASLEECVRTGNGVITARRKKVDFGNSEEIPLLQLFAYFEHKDLIRQTQEKLKIEAHQRKRLAIERNEVNTCECCFDDEVMPEDIIVCVNECMVCKECIGRSTEILFGENNLTFPCLANCGAFIPLEVLQSCVNPKIFCKIAKRKQLDEVKAAGMEDLEICPFCDFAAIPAADDKVFKCFNIECMKETCRLCKEPSHIPLRCDELEGDKDVKQRVFVENQMTEALMRKCWKCGLKFIKSDGCNKISCQCGATMCYICNQPKVDYKHFNGQGAKEYHKCPLFSNTELLHEQNAIQGGLQAKQELGIDAMKVDPLADADARIDYAKKNYVKRPGE